MLATSKVFIKLVCNTNKICQMGKRGAYTIQYNTKFIENRHEELALYIHNWTIYLSLFYYLFLEYTTLFKLRTIKIKKYISISKDFLIMAKVYLKISLI